MKATDLLKKQHREVATLFKSALRSDQPRERGRISSEIIEKLSMHAAIEEEIFYPAFREAAETQKADDLTLEAYEEHHVVKFLLAELGEADPKAEGYTAKLTVLKEIVQHHVEEEQEEMFPAAEKKLGAERLEELGQEMQAAMGVEAPARRRRAS